MRLKELKQSTLLGDYLPTLLELSMFLTLNPFLKAENNAQLPLKKKKKKTLGSFLVWRKSAGVETSADTLSSQAFGDRSFQVRPPHGYPDLPYVSRQKLIEPLSRNDLIHRDGPSRSIPTLQATTCQACDRLLKWWQNLLCKKLKLDEKRDIKIISWLL